MQHSTETLIQARLNSKGIETLFSLEVILKGHFDAAGMESGPTSHIDDSLPM